MRISTFFYALRQGFVSIFRNKWFSLASIATISSCLFLFGLFYVVIQNFQFIVSSAQENVSITVFFDEDIEDATIEKIGDDIKEREGVSKIDFISADEAWESFKVDYFGENAEEAAAGYTENPLEDCSNYEVFLNDVSKQEELVMYIESLPGVSQVNFSKITADTLTGVNSLVAIVSLGIIAILTAVSIFLISNTVRIGISVRKAEINIMKYIGATDFFVRAPYVVEGIIIGILGCIIPLAVIYYLYGVAVTYIMNKFATITMILSFVPVETLFRELIPITVAIGVGIGFIGSYTTVRKHLQV